MNLTERYGLGTIMWLGAYAALVIISMIFAIYSVIVGDVSSACGWIGAASIGTGGFVMTGILAPSPNPKVYDDSRAIMYPPG